MITQRMLDMFKRPTDPSEHNYLYGKLYTGHWSVMSRIDYFANVQITSSSNLIFALYFNNKSENHHQQRYNRNICNYLNRDLIDSNCLPS